MLDIAAQALAANGATKSDVGLQVRDSAGVCTMFVSNIEIVPREAIEILSGQEQVSARVDFINQQVKINYRRAKEIL